MTVINVTLPLELIKDINDYSKIINDILEHDISFNVLKFSIVSSGVTLLLDVPDDKIEIITEALEKNNAIINKKGRVKIDFEICIDCGACISLCPTDALYMNSEHRLEFTEEKCMACLLCLDSCPRSAIKEE
ncbi:MAG: 4Fe-4S dicluster domain-containing protein [Promethearchaeota archaeon]|nr:MAG: 4Fe-4S dicluster domain-containing protein [Candidatus Lokiarchaeota archaeon]